MSEVSAPSMLSPKVLIPFMLTGTIWGSTWFVITGQISDVPAAWGVFYRFMLATPALFQYKLVTSSAVPTNALPMPIARAPTGISRKTAAVVPDFETFCPVACVRHNRDANQRESMNGNIFFTRISPFKIQNS